MRCAIIALTPRVRSRGGSGRFMCYYILLSIDLSCSLEFEFSLPDHPDRHRPACYQYILQLYNGCINCTSYRLASQPPPVRVRQANRPPPRVNVLFNSIII